MQRTYHQIFLLRYILKDEANSKTWTLKSIEYLSSIFLVKCFVTDLKNKHVIAKDWLSLSPVKSLLNAWGIQRNGPWDPWSNYFVYSLSDIDQKGKEMQGDGAHEPSKLIDSIPS